MTTLKGLTSLETLAEEINEEFKYTVDAHITSKGKLQLTYKSRKYYECYELEELLSGVMDYISDLYDVDFTIVNYYKNTLLVSVINNAK